MTTLRMPAEWERHEAVWLTWPDNEQTWPENLVAAQIEFSALVHSLAQMVTVRVMVNQSSLEHATHTLIKPDTTNIDLINIPTNDAWARDYAPTFVIEDQQSLVAIDWAYNAWGGKYPPFDNDQQVAEKIAQGLSVKTIAPGLCFEGGAIETNGNGIIISTRSCAEDPRRNADPTGDQLRQAFEHAFETLLGASKTIWLPGTAIKGDDTDGHIDQLVRFTDPTTLVYAWHDSADLEPGNALAANLAELKRQLQFFEPLEFRLIPLPLPQHFQFQGRDIPASYCNFVITNDLVVVPQFGCPEDKMALEILAPLFPDRHLLGLPSRNLAVGLGSFHCLTQQQPQLPRPS